MTKYPWANNRIKLQRAIEKANSDNLTGSIREKRIKEIYVSMGGRLVELSEVKEIKTMSEEEKIDSSDTASTDIILGSDTEVAPEEATEPTEAQTFTPVTAEDADDEGIDHTVTDEVEKSEEASA